MKAKQKRAVAWVIFAIISGLMLSTTIFFGSTSIGRAASYMMLLIEIGLIVFIWMNRE